MLARIDAAVVGLVRAAIIVVLAAVLLLAFPWLAIVALLVSLYLWPGATLAVGLLAVLVGAAYLG